MSYFAHSASSAVFVMEFHSLRKPWIIPDAPRLPQVPPLVREEAREAGAETVREPRDDRRPRSRAPQVQTVSLAQSPAELILPVEKLPHDLGRRLAVRRHEWPRRADTRLRRRLHHPDEQPFV